MKTTAYLSLGSNLGNKQLNLEIACRMLEPKTSGLLLLPRFT